MVSTDVHGRSLRNLRLSVTDKCNLRCAYCMPEENYVWLPKNDILTFDEIARIVDAFVAAGVDKVRLTGGEPLLRRDLPYLIETLAKKPGIRDLALTTNGVLLSELAASLKRSGLHRLTISLDTLRADRFEALARRNELHHVLAGIDAARAAGFTGTKLDTVILRGVNDDELFDLVAFAKDAQVEIRFIEYMDVGGATRWSMEQVVPRAELLARLEQKFGAIQPIVPSDQDAKAAPAERFTLPDGTPFGIIASTTAPFCAACDRSRLTADGSWYLCLYAKLGIDLKTPLRAGESTEQLRARIERVWTARADRGAEQRLALHDERGALLRDEELRRDPRLEMHTRGG
jgi:cyclic pyranopterin phosphate synthase